MHMKWCADLYFMPDIMVAVSKQQKKFQIDKKIHFLAVAN